MSAVVGTESPGLGYEYQRIGYLAEREWARIMDELLKFFSCWGYSSLRFGQFPFRGTCLNFDLQQSKTNLESISIGLIFSAGLFLRGAIPIIAPDRIILKPWSNLGLFSRVMTVIEKAHQEGILADGFRMIYCCFLGVKGFSISIEHPDY